jgi:Glycosyltransferase family 87
VRSASARIVAFYLLLASAITAQQTLGHARSNNFAIFRASFWHLLRGQDLYAWYPAEHWDLFKYTPTCAMLFAPFAVLPYGGGLFVWNVLNALALSGAVVMLLPGRAGVSALLIVLLEALGALQNTQSNALVAGLMVLSVVALERQRVAAGAAAILAGAVIKVFPLSAGLFGLLTPMRWRHVAWCALVGVAFVVLPLLVTSPELLAMQYRSWLAVQEQDTAKIGMAWMGGIIELAFGRAIPHAPVQLFGVLVVVTGAWLARDRWHDETVRRLLLSSLLIFAVVFNHMAESPSFVIAYTGLGIWWASMPRERWRDALLLVIVLLGSVGGSDLVPKDIRVAYHGKTQLKAIVTLLGWFALQYDLWRTVQQPRIAPAAVA